MTLHAQSASSLYKRLAYLNEHVDFKFDTTGLSALPKFDYLCKDEQNSADYLVTDLNFDGLNDLIFSGPCNPYPQTGIFLNDGQHLKKVFDYPGSIVALEKRNNEITINVLKEACCCDYYAEFIEITIDHSHVVTNKITFDGNTKIRLNNKLKQVKAKGIIRTSPEIDDQTRKDSCRDDVIKGNHLAYIDKETTVFELNTAGLWRLVLHQENPEQSWVGWMSLE